MISCLLGRDDVVKLLLKHGADTGLTDGDQLNSFHYSIWGMVREREREREEEELHTSIYSTIHTLYTYVHCTYGEYMYIYICTLYISLGCTVHIHIYICTLYISLGYTVHTCVYTYTYVHCTYGNYIVYKFRVNV